MKLQYIGVFLRQLLYNHIPMWVHEQQLLPFGRIFLITIIEERNKGNKLKVCIGSDSQVKGEVTEFATVIVFLREHKGGFMFISNDKSSQTMTIKERMILEVAKSVEVAYKLCDLFD